MFRRYQILKFLLGMMSLFLLTFQFSKRFDEEEEQKNKHEADLKTFAFQKTNPNAHFFVSCGGFI